MNIKKLTQVGLVSLFFSVGACAMDSADESNFTDESTEVAVKQQALVPCQSNFFIKAESTEASQTAWNYGGWDSNYTNSTLQTYYYYSQLMQECGYTAQSGVIKLSQKNDFAQGCVQSGVGNWQCNNLKVFYCPQKARIVIPSVPGAFWVWATSDAYLNSSTYDAVNRRIWCNYPAPGLKYVKTAN